MMRAARQVLTACRVRGWRGKWDAYLRQEGITPSTQSLGLVLSRDRVWKGWQQLHAGLELVRLVSPVPGQGHCFAMPILPSSPLARVHETADLG